MEYGGITPIGLPAAWRLLVDAARADGVDAAMIGSGVRRSKIILPGSALGDLPGAEVVEGLGRPTWLTLPSGSSNHRSASKSSVRCVLVRAVRRLGGVDDPARLGQVAAPARSTSAVSSWWG